MSASGAGRSTVAIIGAPNAGKSTLFNALTGRHVSTGNWAGTSVDVERAPWRGRSFDVLDLPGASSLDPLTPDEARTRDLLDSHIPDAVVVVADAAHLTRSLFLPAQVRERPLRCVVAITMLDVADQRRVVLDLQALASVLGCPVVGVDPRRRTGLDALADAVESVLAGPVPGPRPHPAPDADLLALDDDRFALVDEAVRAGLDLSEERLRDASDRIDQVATHPVGGGLLFLGVLWVVFQGTTLLAAPVQQLLDDLISGPVTDAARGALASRGLGGTWVEGLLVSGLVAGVGMLLSFVPVMATMFTLLALLEDSGYLARAAVVTDRLMRVLGLPGKAFLPIVVGFGCNVAAIGATRMLTDRRQRVLTALLVPYTSCSARLTVYVMVATTFFGGAAGSVVFAMYVASVVFVVGVGLLLRRTLWRAMGSEPLLLDLPPYQRPRLAIIAASAWARLADFLKTVAGIVVVAVCVVWLLQSLPVAGGSFGAVPVADSVYGVASRAIAPLFAPAGFGAWQLVAALVVGAVAKETVITSWAQTYAQDASGGDLGARLGQTFAEASGGHTLAAVIAFLVFLVAYTPCIATMAAQRREIGTRWTLLGMLLNLVVAWAAAVATFQVARFFA